MRVFLIACLATVGLAIAAVFVLGSVQEPTGVAYSTGSTRTNYSWSWRETATPVAQNASLSMSKTSDAPSAECRRAGAWTYFRTDFAGTRTADPICH
jgi:hypothetical protein